VVALRLEVDIARPEANRATDQLVEDDDGITFERYFLRANG
jgi:hypothetical protein